MFRIKGVIDCSSLDAGASRELVATRRDGGFSARLPGLELHWSATGVDVALVDGMLVAATGRPRFPAATSAGIATHWARRYTDLGAKAPADVGGGFAAVIIDLARRRAFLCVDRFSIETLCYRGEGSTLAFSDAACDVPGGSRAPSPQALYDYLYFHIIPAPTTVFGDVKRLEHGGGVTLEGRAAVAAPYWTPDFVEHDTHDLRGRMTQFLDLVRAGVEEEADAPATACFLSGGTDSSTVAGMLARARSGPVHAYSIGFDAAGYDEMEYARIAARHFKLEHHEYYITADDLVDAIPRVAASYDQPFGNSSVLPAYYCALRAKEDGFERMLAGDGGDELFGGNSRYATQQIFELYHSLPRGLRSGVLEPVATGWSLFKRVPPFRQAGGYVRHSMVTMPARLETFNLLHRVDVEAMLAPEFLAGIDRTAPLARQCAVWDGVHAGSLLNRMLGYDWKFTLADSDLPKVRGATALAGVSVGYPFLSRDLTDFSLALPPRWKLKGMKLRWFFKEALSGFLPVEILKKKKHGFGLPFGHMALTHPGLKALVTDSLEGIARRGVVRAPFAKELLTRQLPEHPGYYGELVWILMMLEQWLRAHEQAP